MDGGGATSQGRRGLLDSWRWKRRLAALASLAPTSSFIDCCLFICRIPARIWAAQELPSCLDTINNSDSDHFLLPTPPPPHPPPPSWPVDSNSPIIISIRTADGGAAPDASVGGWVAAAGAEEVEEEEEEVVGGRTRCTRALLIQDLKGFRPRLAGDLYTAPPSPVLRFSGSVVILLQSTPSRISHRPASTESQASPSSLPHSTLCVFVCVCRVCRVCRVCVCVCEPPWNFLFILDVLVARGEGR